MWKELTIKVLPCYLGEYPGWIEVTDGKTTLIKQPIGAVNTARRPQQISQLNPTYSPTGAGTAVIAEHAAMYGAVDDLLDTYKFLTVWKKFLLHHNIQNDLLCTIITENDSKSLCIPFEAVVSLALRERGKPDISEIPQIIGSNPSIIFRRKWGTLSSGLKVKVRADVLYYYSGTALASTHEGIIQGICASNGTNFVKITDISQINTDRPWIFYFIGHGGSRGIWNEDNTSQNLLPAIKNLDLSKCNGVILNCCRTSSFLNRDEIMTDILAWPLKPTHIFANCFSVQADIAMERGKYLLENLLSNMDAHEALSGCIMNCAGIDDQKLSFSWFDCT